MITLRQSGKQLQGYAFVITSILLQTLGYLLVFKCLINSATMTALTFVLSDIVFGALTVKRWAYIAKVIQRDIGLFIRFSIYVFVMVAPVFLCEIHGVHPIVYCLIFSAGMAGIAALEKRSAWCALYFLMTGITLYVGIHTTPYTLLALLGPIGGFQVLRLSSRYIQTHQATTSEIMVLRFVLLAGIALCLAPYFQFTLLLTHWHLALLGASIVLSLNILPVYCSQKAVAYVGHNTVAVSFAFMPVIIFIEQLDVIRHTHIELLGIAIALFATILVAKRYPLIIKSNTLLA